MKIINTQGSTIPKVFLMLLIFVGGGFGQDNLLSRVPELQETARKANGGVLGCGFGLISLITSRGRVKVGVSLDPIHVFGDTIVVADLLTLLEARVEANRSGKQNPMSGEISDLVYVIFSTLAESKDPEAIPVMVSLLEDKNDVIRGWSAIVLFRLGESERDLKLKIEGIAFPKLAVQSAAARGVKVPSWAKVKDS